MTNDMIKPVNCGVYMFTPGCSGLLAAFCALATPWQGLGLGAVGGLVSIAGVELLEKLKIDDPVGEWLNH